MICEKAKMLICEYAKMLICECPQKKPSQMTNFPYSRRHVLWAFANSRFWYFQEHKTFLKDKISSFANKLNC